MSHIPEPIRFMPFERRPVLADKLNRLSEKVDEIEDDIESLSVDAAPDPGDLTVYYENGKA